MVKGFFGNTNVLSKFCCNSLLPVFLSSITRLTSSLLAIIFACSFATSANDDGVLAWQMDSSNANYMVAQGINGMSYQFVNSNRFLMAKDSGGVNQWAYAHHRYEHDIFRTKAVVSFDGTIYIYSVERFFAISPKGQVKWVLDNRNYYHAPTIAENGVVYFNQANRLNAYSREGQYLWGLNVGYAVSAPAVAVDGTIFTNIGDIIAVNPDGSEKWRYDDENKIENFILADDNRLILRVRGNDGDSGELQALNANGELLWRYQGSSNLCHEPVVGTDGVVICPVNGQGVIALNADGSELWNVSVDDFTTSVSTAVISTSGRFYLSSDKQVYAFEADGSIRWRYEADATIASSLGLDDDGILKFSTSNNKIVGLHTTGGGLADTAWPTEGQNFQRMRRVSPDQDNDGLADFWEALYGLSTTTNNAEQDTDNDGFTDLQEYLNSTNPLESRDVPTIDGSLIYSMYVGDTYNAIPSYTSDGSRFYLDNAGTIVASGTAGSWRFRVSTSNRTLTTTEDHRVYVGLRSGELYAIKDGQKQWHYQTGGEVKYSPSVNYDGTVVFASRDGYIYAVSPDGELKWRFNTETEAISSIAISPQSFLYFGTADKGLMVLDIDGNLKWSAEAGDRVNTPVVDAKGNVYFGSDDKHLYGYSVTGEKLWQYQAQDEIRTSPAIDENGSVIVVTKGADVLSVNSSGELNWTANVVNNYGSSVAVGRDGSVYIGAQNGIFSGFDNTGYLKWQFRQSSGVSASAVILRTGKIIHTSTVGVWSMIKTTNSGIARHGWPMEGGGPNHLGRYPLTDNLIDSDGDGIADGEDNCPNVANPDQLNTDGANDGGNACDADDDNDGVNDEEDAFPLDANESLDSDKDGIGNNADTDDDNDGMSDSWEVRYGLNPLDASDAALDADGDGLTNLQEYQLGSDPTDASSVGKPVDVSHILQWLLILEQQ